MKLGLSFGALVERYGYEKAFKICKESGFDTVEIGLHKFGTKEDPLDIYNKSDDEFETFFTNIKKYADDAEIEFSSAHGRMSVDTPDEEQCRFARWASKKDLKAASVLGAPICVIHSIINSHWPAPYNRDEEFLYARNAEFFNHIAPTAEENNVKICLETFGKVIIDGQKEVTFFAHAHQMKKQFETLNTQNKTICVDVGHSNEAHYWGAISPADTIRYLGANVTHLHLHDNNGTVDMHAAPMIRDGLNWPDIFDALDEINYSGVYNFEINMAHYGACLEDAAHFFGKYLRYLVENKGRVREQI